ncbi:MAG TPA: glycosyltransferase family 4 protein [Syntrophorhabdaceae bacterium]|nr:glycosyltransferase family 4 protein [Syntrophorhabdaceae bacterium]
MKDKKICFVAAIELSIRVFMVGHLKRLSNEYSITVAVNTDNTGFLKPYGLDVKVFPVRILRRPAPASDVLALFRLYRFFKREGFDAVHSITPKAGLLSMFAAYLAGVPIRIHTFTGQVWATAKGTKRWFLKSMDKLIARCATHVLADSRSQLDFIISEGVVWGEKASVIGNGSICGVDSERFRPDPETRKMVREQLSIPEDSILFLFLGRLTFDKGLLDLAGAFAKVCRSAENIHLLVAGPDEEGMKEKMLSLCSEQPDRIHFYDFTDAPERFMAAADVFCMPSYREGFGIVVIEAGAAGVSSIGTRIYGVVDAIEDNVTGYLYGPGNVEELAEKMLKMIDEPSRRTEMGGRARERAIGLFSKEIVADAFLSFYRSLPGKGERQGRQD